MSQQRSIKPGEPSSTDIGAIFLNTPEPIMELITIIKAVNIPSRVSSPLE
jgi:hypothetical protein